MVEILYKPLQSDAIFVERAWAACAVLSPCPCDNFDQTNMATETCGRVVLHNRPGVDKPPNESNFAFERIEIPRCKEGEVLVKTLYLSVDPYMRCRMNEDTGVAYLTPWALDGPPTGGGVGKVVQSKSEYFQEEDIVESLVWPWQEFVVFSGENSYLNKVRYHRPPCYSPGGEVIRVSFLAKSLKQGVVLG